MKKVEVCRHCGADISLHPITSDMISRNSELTKPCPLDYAPSAAYPLPFNTRELNDDDKVELQRYWADFVPT
jgi:hypothetical protein